MNVERVAIIGPPRSGKTTLSKAYSHVVHADEYARLGWSVASAQLAMVLNNRHYDCYEGTAVVRALRKWLKAHPGKPVDRVIFIRKPREALNPGQQSMAMGIATIWAEIEPMLRARDVRIEYR